MPQNYMPVRHLKIEPDQAGQRIDNFLITQLKGLPRSRVYRLLRSGQVRINGGRIKAGYRLEAGDEIRIPPVSLPDADANADHIPEGLKAKVTAALIYEDEDYLIFDKPSGLAVHGGSGVKHGFITALRAARDEDEYLELGHRLDRDTSGCLLVAKNRPALLQFQAALKKGAVDKRYLALLAGDWLGGEQVVTHALVKNRTRANERVTAVDPTHRKSKRAESGFTPIKVMGGASLVEVHITTGRTHQIRVQSAELGHPVIGDDKYGDRQVNRQMRKRGLKRLCLHAHTLEFMGAHGRIKALAQAPQLFRPWMHEDK